MKLRFSKRILIGWIIIFSYIMTIFHTFFGTVVVRYSMYAVVILTAMFIAVSTKKYGVKKQLMAVYPILWLYVGLVEVITLLTGMSEKINLGSLIQPIFLISCVTIGYRVTTCVEYSKSDLTEFVLRRILLIMFFAGVAGIPEYFMKSNLFYPNYGNPWQEYRVASIYGHPILYALSMTIGFIMSVFIVMKWKTLKLIMLGIFVFGIFASLSRSSWIAFVAVILIWSLAVYRDRITKKHVIGLLFGTIILIVIVVSPIGQRVIKMVAMRFTNLFEDISSTQRLGSIVYIFNNLVEEFNPFTLLFGHGEDAAAQLMLKTTININNFSTTDNEYLLILYNYGLIALIGIVVFIFRIVKIFIVKYKKLSNIQRCLLLTCIAISITSFFFEVTEAKVCSWITMVIMGMLLAHMREIRRI